MSISAQYAETSAADLLSAFDNGEDVIIARPGGPALRLVIDAGFVEPPPSPENEMRAPQRVSPKASGRWVDTVKWHTPKRPLSEMLGALAGQIELAEDWDSKETNEYIADLFEGVDKADPAGAK